MEALKYFQPKNEQALWKILYEKAKDAEVGTVFTFEQLNNIVGSDVQQNRSPIYRANKELLNKHRKMLISEKNIGYRIGHPQEQIKHGEFRKVRAKRQMEWGLLEITNVDTKNLSPEEKIRLTHLCNHFRLQLRFIKKRNVEALADTQKAVETQKQGLQEINRIMKELENLKKQLSG